MSADFYAWSDLARAAEHARKCPVARPALAFRAAARRLWHDLLLRVGRLSALFGGMAGLWIMAEGWGAGDVQRLFWGLLACGCAGVALWAFEGEACDE
jgi:hypothetical protein